MTPKEIKSFKRSEEYYEMSNMDWDSLRQFEEVSDEMMEKVYIVEGDRKSLMKQCDVIKQQGEEEYENGDDTKLLRIMSAEDNAIDTDGVGIESVNYYSVMLGSYEELSN
jgi:hypothetical protein